MEWAKIFSLLPLIVLLISIPAHAETLTPPEPPQLPDMTQFFRIGGFIEFWQSETMGLFAAGLTALAVSGVYLKTRSIGLTIMVALVAVFLSPLVSWLAVFVGLGLAYLVYRAIYKKNELY